MVDLHMPNTVVGQYRAALAMLRQAIERCPDSLWLRADYPNRYWHIAYHVIFYTHLYVASDEAGFRPWRGHREDSQYLGARPWAPGEIREVEPPYTKAEVLEYLEFCRAEVEARVPELDMSAPSGFSWLPFNKLGVQFYNIRHLQHHTGQLADRLRSVAGVGVAWVRTD